MAACDTKLKAVLEQKSKKLEEVIQRLDHRIKWLESVQFSVYNELQRENEYIVPRIKYVVTMIETKFTEAFLTLQCNFSKQQTVCKRIIQHANEMLKSISKDGSYLDILEQSKRLEDLLVCSLIVLDEESQISIKSLPDRFTQLHDVCQRILDSKLEDNTKQITNSLDSVTAIFRESAEKNDLNYEVAACHFPLPFDNISDKIPESVAFSSDHRHNYPAIPELLLTVNTSFTASIQFVHSLTTYILQPTNDGLLSFSEEFSNYVCQEEQILTSTEKKEFLDNLVPNSVCCAKFSDDNSWYRARIVSKDGERVMVYYLDFGNYELIPLSSNRLHPLPESFTIFPAQTKVCDLRFPNDCLYHIPKSFVDPFYQWLMLILYNTIVEIQVCCCYPNKIIADIVLPSNALCSEESVFFLKQISLNVSDFEYRDDGSIQLLNILCILRDVAFAIEGEYSVKSVLASRLQDTSNTVKRNSRSTNPSCDTTNNESSDPLEQPMITTEQQQQQSIENEKEMFKNSVNLTELTNLISGVTLTSTESAQSNQDCKITDTQTILDNDPVTTAFSSNEQNQSCILPCIDQTTTTSEQLSEKESDNEDIPINNNTEIPSQSLLCSSVTNGYRNSSPKDDEIHEMSFNSFSEISTATTNASCSPQYDDIDITTTECSSSNIYRAVYDTSDESSLSDLSLSVTVSVHDNISSDSDNVSQNDGGLLDNVACDRRFEYPTPIVSDSQNAVVNDMKTKDSRGIISDENSHKYRSIVQCLDYSDTQLHNDNISEDLPLNASFESCVYYDNLIEKDQQQKTTCGNNSSHSKEGCTNQSVAKQLDFSNTDCEPHVNLLQFSSISSDSCNNDSSTETTHVMETANVLSDYEEDDNSEQDSADSLEEVTQIMPMEIMEPGYTVALPSTLMPNSYNATGYNATGPCNLSACVGIAVPVYAMPYSIMSYNLQHMSLFSFFPNGPVYNIPVNTSNDTFHPPLIMTSYNTITNTDPYSRILSINAEMKLSDEVECLPKDQDNQLAIVGKSSLNCNPIPMDSMQYPADENTLLEENNKNSPDNNESLSSIQVVDYVHTNNDKSFCECTDDPSEEKSTHSPINEYCDTMEGESLLTGKVQNDSINYEQSNDTSYSKNVVTAHVPVVTTHVPVVTTCVPVVTTRLPVVTTRLPVIDSYSSINNDNVTNDDSLIQITSDDNTSSNFVDENQNNECIDFILADITNVNNSIAEDENNDIDMLETSILDSLLNMSPICDYDDYDDNNNEPTFIPPPPEFCNELDHNDMNIEESTHTCTTTEVSSSQEPVSGTHGTIQNCLEDQVFTAYHHIDLKLDDELQFHLVVSHVESPSLFFVFPINQVGALLYKMENDLFSYYVNSSNCKLIDSKSVRPGTPCCLRNMEEGVHNFYRGLITSNAIISNNGIECTVLCVDYGWSFVSRLESVFKLDNCFFVVPVMITACSLFGVVPTISKGIEPPKTSNDDSIESIASPVLSHCRKRKITSTWSKEASDKFYVMVTDKVLVGTVYEKDDTKCLYGMFVKHIVLLYDTNSVEDSLINYLLVEQQLAVLCVNDSDGKSEDMSSIDDWNPMEQEYLSSRNDYNVNDEDVGSALLKQDSRINIPCKYYNTALGCYRDNCQFQHSQNDSNPQTKEEAYVVPSTTILPSSCSSVLLLVTAVRSTNRFNGIIVGTLDDTDVKCHDSYLDFLMLLNEMDSFYNSNSQEYKLTSFPGRGEIVCVWNDSHCHWYRSLVIMEESDNTVKVYYIDIGYEEVIPLKQIYTLCPQFVHVHSQAVEFVLSNTCIPKGMTQDGRDKGKNVVCKLTTNKILLAMINYRYNSMLYVEVFKTRIDHRQLSNKNNTSLNKHLISHGHLSYYEDKFTSSLQRKTGVPLCNKVVFMPG